MVHADHPRPGNDGTAPLARFRHQMLKKAWNRAYLRSLSFLVSV